MSIPLGEISVNTPIKSPAPEREKSPGGRPKKRSPSPYEEMGARGGAVTAARRRRNELITAQQDMLVNPRGEC